MSFVFKVNSKLKDSNVKLEYALQRMLTVNLWISNKDGGFESLQLSQWKFTRYQQDEHNP